MSEMLFTEVFDSDSEKNYPVINLNPKAKIPNTFGIKVPGNENLVAKMVSYTSEGDAVKQVKAGDRYAHVILMSLSEKGTPAELKGGLGLDPIGALNTIFDTIYANVRKYKMDAILFRFPAKKMKGQAHILQRVMKRLVQQRAAGRFAVLDAMFNFTAKHAYVLVYRKSKPIEDISGIPGINADLYTRVESQVGDVYVSKKDGVQVTKDDAIAGSIAAVEKSRSDKTVIMRTKISRRVLAQSQSLSTDNFTNSKWEEYENTASKLSKPATAEPIKNSEELKSLINSDSTKYAVAEYGSDLIAGRMNNITKIPGMDRIAREKDIAKKLVNRLKDTPVTSLKSMEVFTEELLANIDLLKDDFFAKNAKNYGPTYYTEEEKQAGLERMWVQERTNAIRNAVSEYADKSAGRLRHFTEIHDPDYTAAQKRGIKEYVGSGYSDINDYLLGRYNPNMYDTLQEPEVIKAIDSLDSAFEKGERLPEGITLWRAQTIRAPIWESLIKNKVFYFRNFVSTSMRPIIFGAWKGSAALGVAPDEVRTQLTVDKTEEEMVAPVIKTDIVRAMVGWALEGGHKINVIYPGSLSMAKGEVEIILPRGTTIQINKITDASYNNGIEYRNQKLIQGEIMTSDQLDEAVVYDGDALFETGELIEMADEPTPVDSFDQFVKAEKTSPSRTARSLLAALIDIDDMPERFVQG